MWPTPEQVRQRIEDLRLCAWDVGNEDANLEALRAERERITAREIKEDDEQ